MLEVVKSYSWKYEKDHVWLGGYSLGLMHIPPMRGIQLGVGGGFAREIDARMAIKAIKEEYPYFDFDNCSLEEWEKLLENQGEDTIRRVTMEHLQW